MSYRDDHAALTGYHDDLARQLGELEAKAADLAGVEAERARVAAELARVRTDLAYRTARRAPVRLANLRVASPCKVAWDAMKGDDHQRDCAKCEKTVYNISAMTTEAAEEFLAARGTSACVRFFRRFDGTILTADCPVGARQQRRKLAIAAGVIAGVAGTAGVARMVTADDGAPLVADSVNWDNVEVGGVANDPSDFPTMGEIAAPAEHYQEIKGDVAYTDDLAPEKQRVRPKAPHKATK